jgi:serine protease Do
MRASLYYAQREVLLAAVPHSDCDRQRICDVRTSGYVYATHHTMSTRFSRLAVPHLLLAGVVALFAGCDLRAQRATAKESDAAVSKQPPRATGDFRINIDKKPIDRNSADRVSYAPVVRKTAHSIVYVYSTRQVRQQDMPDFLNDPLFRRYFNIPEGSGRRAASRPQQGLGSGVIATRDGYILTNNHVIDDADDVKVSIGDSPRRYDAKVVGGDPMADIAVLKIEVDAGTELVPATFGDSDQLEVGDIVLAIGNPFGIGQSVSSGIVSAVGRGNLGIEQIEDFIQTDAAINRGNSGGGLLDSQGRVVGINTAIVSGGPSGGFAGVGFAIPVNLALNVAQQIVETGRVERGFLGVEPQDLTADLAAQFGTDSGALLSRVIEDGPAAKAGLREGDVIVGIGDVVVRDSRQLLLTVSQLRPDSTAKVRYLRDGKEHTADVKLTRRPSASGAAPRLPERGEGEGVLNGVSIDELTPELRARLNIPARVEGVIVTEISPTSPAAGQGLREGDVVAELNRRKLPNVDEAMRVSREVKGPKVLLRIWREGRFQYVVIDESKRGAREKDEIPQ